MNKPTLIELKTPFGTIYHEGLTPDSREEIDRIKIYDSRKKYLDYLPIEDPYNINAIILQIAEFREFCKTVTEFDTLLNKLVGGDDNWSFHSSDVNEVLDMMLELEEWNSFREEVLENLLDNFGVQQVTTKAEEEHFRYLFEQNEWINFIGKEIVLMYEY